MPVSDPVQSFALVSFGGRVIARTGGKVSSFESLPAVRRARPLLLSTAPRVSPTRVGVLGKKAGGGQHQSRWSSILQQFAASRFSIVYSLGLPSTKKALAYALLVLGYTLAHKQLEPFGPIGSGG